jgi:hypothetical protein
MIKPMEALGAEFFDPLWWVQDAIGLWHARCGYIINTDGACPNNQGGICRTAFAEIPVNFCHKPDKNNWKCPCG